MDSNNWVNNGTKHLQEHYLPSMWLLLTICNIYLFEVEYFLLDDTYC